MLYYAECSDRAEGEERIAQGFSPWKVYATKSPLKLHAHRTLSDAARAGAAILKEKLRTDAAGRPLAAFLKGRPVRH